MCEFDQKTLHINDYFSVFNWTPDNYIALIIIINYVTGS